MSNIDKKVYVIRDLGSFYNDEYHSQNLTSDSHEGHICAFFEDKESAIQEWKRLEYKFSHEHCFDNVFLYKKLRYELEKTGLDINDFLAKDKYKKLSPDELFELIHKLNCHVFFLYEYPADLKVKTLWSIVEKNYDLCDATTDYDCRPNIFLTTFLSQYAEIPLNGKLDDLSDTPQLLSQLIKDNPNIQYDKKYQRLKIQPDAQTLNSVNALLKKPLFEIRYLTIKEIYEIEQTLNSPNNQVA